MAPPIPGITGFRTKNRNRNCLSRERVFGNSCVTRSVVSYSVVCGLCLHFVNAGARSELQYLLLHHLLIRDISLHEPEGLILRTANTWIYDFDPTILRLDNIYISLYNTWIFLRVDSSVIRLFIFTFLGFYFVSCRTREFSFFFCRRNNLNAITINSPSHSLHGHESSGNW
jgi:hypothetical protein